MKFQNTRDKENVRKISRDYKQITYKSGRPELHENSQKQLLKQENKKKVFQYFKEDNSPSSFLYKPMLLTNFVGRITIFPNFQCL